jgi:hypothetical protein
VISYRTTVAHDGVLYLCRPEPRGARCGKCLRGWIVLDGRLRAKCRVCGALTCDHVAIPAGCGYDRERRIFFPTL